MRDGKSSAPPGGGSRRATDPSGTGQRAGWRGGVPFVLFALVTVAALVGALTAATNQLAAAQFATTGHWVFNSALQTVFHVDGATTNIDARAAVPGDPGSQVVQGDNSGYVVGGSQITEFDKAGLAPQRTMTPPAAEVPLGIEVVGGPYLVYRNAGKIVRLGDPPATVSAGGPVSDPVATEDGTLWLHRTGVGVICTLPRDADSVSACPVSVPGDHAGALALVGDRPTFVDLFAGTLHPIAGDQLGAGVPIGVPLSPNSRLAANDVAGRVVILDPARHSIVLADTANPPAPPVTVALPGGDYDGPLSTGSAVVLVDRRNGSVLTFGADGTRKDEKPIRRQPGERQPGPQRQPGQQQPGQPRLSRGEDDRVYVEDAEGTQVLVVAEDGSVRDVPVLGTPEVPAPQPDERTDQRQDQSVALPADQPGAQPGNQRAGPPRTDQRAPVTPPRTAAQPPPAQPPPTPRPPAQKPPEQPPTQPPSPPGAPTEVSASAGDGSATVTWAPAPNNRAPITAYRVSWQASNGRTGEITVAGTARRATVTGLANGVRHTLTVAATNRVGTGPGASADPVTPTAPVSPADAPTNLKATYDVDDRPTRDVQLSWRQPALNGGTLVHYEVTGTGLGTRQVTGTQTVYPQLEAARVYTFTVRAVTRTPDGQLRTGESASLTVKDEQPATPTATVAISRGRDGETDNCHPPQCSFINAAITGLEPNTRYAIRLSSTSNTNVRTEHFTTNASGSANYNQLNYDVPGETVWIAVRTPDGWVESNKIYWERQ
ncbi:fibronectin type III domain-containing protein [Goodfellowiella coeruleoviolacea]|uniref:fibronectin type III domain-containing protein n=1 Tax=Goodfellowiella coeruleoviolacea TaxID=334858 RepID=UPI0020A4910D|nr:fibronectin type III domain-containing protein [Goodfellowiella coeruleoviolacea]